MASLSSLSAELALEISKHLDYGGQVNLSSTCRQFRQRLLRDVFGELHLSTRPEHCSRVLELAREYGCYTRRLYFSARVEIYDDDYIGSKPFVRPALPKHGAVLISGASEDGPGDAGRRRPLLPNLHSLIIDIHPGDSPLNREPHVMNGAFRVAPWAPAPTAEAMRRLEKRHGWRALLTEVWAAASANRTVRHVTVEGYQPARTSALMMPEYRAFLGRLESLNIVISARTARSRGYDASRAPSFQAFVCSALNETFFEHAVSLRRLRIESKEWMFLSVASDRHPGLAKLDMATHMPLLEHVELRGFLVSQGLADCLRACREKLTSIRLTNAIAEGQYYKLGYAITVYDDGGGAVLVPAQGHFPTAFINWARCLEGLADTERLCRFDVDFDYPDRRHGRVPFSRADIWGGEDSTRDLDPRSVVMKARALRRQEPTRQVFEYFHSFGSCDTVTRDPNVNSKAFLLGKDQEAYDALEAVTARNRARRDMDSTKRVVDI